MNKYFLTAVGAFLFFAMSASVQAEKSLLGTWKGEFKGIFIMEQRAQGPAYRYDQLRDVSKEPEVVKNPLTVVIDFQQGDIARGHWMAAIEGKENQGDSFICGMLVPDEWRCIDPSGTNTVRMVSDTEMRMCYFASRGIYGGGCATVKKVE